MLLLALALALLLPPSALSEQTVLASDAAFVTRVGRPYPSALPGALGLSWLGGGVRVSFTGRALRAAFAPTLAGFKVRVTQSVDGYFPAQGVVWVLGSNATEAVPVASGCAGGCVAELVLNVDAQYFESAGPESLATLLSLTTDGTFNAAPPPPSVTMHIVGDSITAATNIHGGVDGNCADGGFQCDYGASWGGLLCGHFGASCSTIAVGSQTVPTMTRYYQQARFASSEPFPFNDTAPQIFAAYLGVNDMWGQNQSAALDATFAANWLIFFNLVKAKYPMAAKIKFFLLLGPMVAGGGLPASPRKMEPGVLKAVADGVAAGFDVTYINATAACGPGLTGCVDGCGGGHPGESGHRGMALTALPFFASALGLPDWPF